jgi:hypothetical protein
MTDNDSLARHRRVLALQQAVARQRQQQDDDSTAFDVRLRTTALDERLLFYRDAYLDPRAITGGRIQGTIPATPRR